LVPYIFEESFRHLLLSQNPNNNCDELLIVLLFARIR
jgi:hypothetical protein